MRLFNFYAILSLIVVFPFQLLAQSCCHDHLNDIYSVNSYFESAYASELLNFDNSTTVGVAKCWVGEENTCSKKPLLILIHGGGFTGGSSQLMDSLAVSFARKGYFSATISYRLGWLGEGFCSYDTTEAIRAWYRSVKDAQLAIDYFKSHNEEFSIDTNLIFLAGWSAGGYTALGASLLDMAEEKPSQCFELSPLVFNQNQVLRPDLGEVHRDIPQIKAIATFSSAILFPELMLQGTNADLIAFNNDLDPYFIPINSCSPWWQIENCALNYPIACGIQSLSEFFNSLQITHQAHVFNSDICPHNLHEPCFPFWQEEVELMAQFFNQKMSCEIPLSSNAYNEHVYTLSSLHDLNHMKWPNEYILTNIHGAVVQNKSGFSNLTEGIYFLKDLELGSMRRLIIKQ